MIAPLPSNAMQTFTLKRPPGAEFWRKATCEEIDCGHWRNGWETRIDISTELGQEQVAYIIKHSKRSYSMERESEDIVCFTFTPGQMCFGAADHRIAIEREPLYLHRAGLATPRRHTRGADWMEHMHEQTDKTITLKERG